MINEKHNKTQKDKNIRIKSKPKSHERQNKINNKGIEYLEKPLMKYNTIELINIPGSVGGGKTLYRSKNIKSNGKLDLKNNMTLQSLNRDWRTSNHRTNRTTSLKKSQSYLEYYELSAKN